MGKPFSYFVGVVAIAVFGASPAGVVNEVPSCYRANKLEHQLPAPAKEIFVLIDQTTLFDDKLQNSVYENTWGYLGPDSSYTVVSFSAFSQGRYTEVVSAGIIEPPFPARERDSTSVRLLNSFEECMKGQEAWAKRRAVEAIKKTFLAASHNLAKSDILAALKDVSALVKASPAKDKVLFVVSDMLENSTLSNFYASSTRVRVVEPAKELAAIEKASMFGDFGTARVFVLGAGLIGPSGDSKSTYRDPKTMKALHDFWAKYFERSGAKLEQFGQPALLQPIR
jgi:hypothetical protein